MNTDEKSPNKSLLSLDKGSGREQLSQIENFKITHALLPHPNTTEKAMANPGEWGA